MTAKTITGASAQTQLQARGVIQRGWSRAAAAAAAAGASAAAA